MTWFRNLGLLLAGLDALLAQPLPTPAPEEFLRQISTQRLPVPAAAATRGFAPPGKIDPRLMRLLASLPDTGNERSLIVGTPAEALVPVVIQSAGLARADAVKAAVTARRGQVTADFENTVWARIPRDAAASLASLPDVASISVQSVYNIQQEPDSPDSARTSAPPGDGMRAAHLDALLRRGITGKGVRIGILDRGFGGYGRLLRLGKVKEPRGQRAFPASYGVENSEVHGTASAEVLSLAAPGAELYLASFDGNEDHMVDAAKWLLSQGVQIISYSAGNVVNANDGTDAVSRFLDDTTQKNGVLWVVAAGNHAGQHWSGDSAEARNQGILSETTWPDGQKGLVVTALSNTLRIVVRWSDWGPNPRITSATEDIDAYLYGRDDRGKLYEVARSTDSQNGGAAKPIEVIDLTGKDLAGHQFLLTLHARHLTRRVRIHVFLDPSGGGNLYPANASGSILNPASARSALAVGAVDILTNAPAPYSSRGPTDDGRVKPEVTGPTNTISWALEDRGSRFKGTSASCPHVAAFAALLKELSPNLSSADLRLMVLRSVKAPPPEQSASLMTAGFIDASVVPVFHPRTENIAVTDFIEVPPEFGDRISAASLKALGHVANEPRDGLSARVVSEKDLYRIGEKLRLEVRATRDSACLLFVRDAKGEYSLISSEHHSYLAIKGGESTLFPPPGEGTLEVTGPPGTDELLLVCSATPVPLDSTVTRPDGPSRIAVASHSYLIVERQ